MKDELIFFSGSFLFISILLLLLIFCIHFYRGHLLNTRFIEIRGESSLNLPHKKKFLPPSLSPHPGLRQLSAHLKRMLKWTSPLLSPGQMFNPFIFLSKKIKGSNLIYFFPASTESPKKPRQLALPDTRSPGEDECCSSSVWSTCDKCPRGNWSVFQENYPAPWADTFLLQFFAQQ